MRGSVAHTYKMMAASVLPVIVFNVASVIFMGTERIPVQDTTNYLQYVVLLACSFLALGLSIAKFRACLDVLSRQLNAYAFSIVMRTRITPALFFVFGFMVGTAMTVGSGEIDLSSIGELELIRQATAATVISFFGIAGVICVKTQIAKQGR